MHVQGDSAKNTRLPRGSRTHSIIQSNLFPRSFYFTFGKKSGVIHMALRYNNLPPVYSKISNGAHRFAVFESTYRFNISYSTDREGGTIVRVILPACENGVTLLFRQRSYPLLRILLFIGSTLAFSPPISSLSFSLFLGLSYVIFFSGENTIR